MSIDGQLRSPTGSRIVGTCDTVPCVAGTASWVKNADGSLEPNYEGGSAIDWDGQETRMGGAFGDQMLVQDENGEEWPIGDCTFVEEGSDVDE